MRDTLLVLAEAFQHHRIRREYFLDPPRNGCCKHIRVRDGHFYVQVSEVAAPKTLSDVKGLSVRVPTPVEPAPVIETRCIDHQSVSLPASNRVPQPGWAGIVRKLAAVSV